MQFVYIACPLGSRPSASLEIFLLVSEGRKNIDSFLRSKGDFQSCSLACLLELARSLQLIQYELAIVSFIGLLVLVSSVLVIASYIIYHSSDLT